MVQFSAFYEDATKLEAVARKRGWASDADGSHLDFVDPAEGCIQTGKSFTSKSAAMRWLKTHINALHTAFGVGEITEIEEIERPARCQYCTCGGQKAVRRYVVSDIGVETDEPIDDCYND